MSILFFFYQDPLIHFQVPYIIKAYHSLSSHVDKVMDTFLLLLSSQQNMQIFTTFMLGIRAELEEGAKISFLKPLFMLSGPSKTWTFFRKMPPIKQKLCSTTSFALLLYLLFFCITTSWTFLLLTCYFSKTLYPLIFTVH